MLGQFRKIRKKQAVLQRDFFYIFRDDRNTGMSEKKLVRHR
jgi:hypothetical protein